MTNKRFIINERYMSVKWAASLHYTYPDRVTLYIRTHRVMLCDITLHIVKVAVVFVAVVVVVGSLSINGFRTKQSDLHITSARFGALAWDTQKRTKLPLMLGRLGTRDYKSLGAPLLYTRPYSLFCSDFLSDVIGSRSSAITFYMFAISFIIK